MCAVFYFCLPPSIPVDLAQPPSLPFPFFSGWLCGFGRGEWGLLCTCLRMAGWSRRSSPANLTASSYRFSRFCSPWSQHKLGQRFTRRVLITLLFPHPQPSATFFFSSKVFMIIIFPLLFSPEQVNTPYRKKRRKKKRKRKKVWDLIRRNILMVWRLWHFDQSPQVKR